MRREYKTGSKYAIWRYKDIYWNNELYLRRLILIQCPLFSVMIHWIKSPDRQRHLHDHPVDMLSIILRGGYYEITNKTAMKGRILHRAYDYQHVRKWFNWIPAHKSHRIRGIIKHPVITLCFAGPRTREWGFYTENGWVHWKKYHELYDSSTS